ncbi:hypothetical protein D3C85_1678670 [compost metagenome]
MKDIEDLCTRSLLIADGKLIYDGNLKDINVKLNQNKIIKLKFSASVKADQLECFGTVRHSDHDQATLEIPREQVNVMSRELLTRLPVQDISIEDIPIEEMIVSLYQRNRVE